MRKSAAVLLMAMSFTGGAFAADMPARHGKDVKVPAADGMKGIVHLNANVDQPLLALAAVATAA
jgi:hypothetical protein